MIITHDFVYIHMPKTGGSFVERALQQLFSGRPDLYLDTSTARGREELGVPGQHQTVVQIPDRYRNRPIAFTIRNPYDHYVSFYEFGWWKDHPYDTFDEEAIRVRYPHYPELSFQEYLEANYTWELLSPTYLEATTARRLRAENVGPLTYDYVRFLFDHPDDLEENLRALVSADRPAALLPDVHFLRMEHLNEDLFHFLQTMGHEAARSRFVLTMENVYPDGPRRASADWTPYYTPEARRLVRERERILFGMFPDYDGAAERAARPGA